MANKIDTPGVYRFKITESKIGLTKKSEYPQWIVRCQALEKYIDEPDHMAHYGLEAPGWVDWSAYNEEIVGYLVLFNSSDSFDEDSALANYEQACKATGWAGDSFDSLEDVVDSVILGRVEEEEYQGRASLKLNWVDHRDAPPQRELRGLDQDKLTALNAKLKMGAKKPATPAKPAAPGKPSTAPASESEADAPSQYSSALSPKPGKPGKASREATADDEPTLPPSKSDVKTAEAESPPASEESQSATTASPSEDDPILTADDPRVAAWQDLHRRKKANGWTDKQIQDAWIEADGHIVGDRNPDEIEAFDWVRLRDKVMLILGA